MAVIEEFQSAKVFIVLAVREVIDNEDILTAETIELFYDVAADKTGTACYNDHFSAS